MTTPLLAMVALAGACWVVRVFAIVVLPAERLPRRVRDGLDLLAPAVLAALVAVETDSAMSGGGFVAVVVLVAVAGMGLAARLTGSLVLPIGLGLGTALLLDLVIL
ncbi:MAG: AzlD domain-containing protein [Marmoricola sp.]